MFRHRPWQNAGDDFVYASTGGSRPLHSFLGTNDRRPPPSVIANQCAHWCGNPFSLLPWYSLSPAKESTQRTPPKPMVQESFPRLKRRLYRPPFAPRIGLCKIHAVLSYRLCAYLRDALCACAGCPNGGTFCIYRAWRCGHRPLRNSIGKRSVGAGVPDGPRPALHLTSCEQQCHYETSAHAGRGNP